MAKEFFNDKADDVVNPHGEVTVKAWMQVQEQNNLGLDVGTPPASSGDIPLTELG